MTNGVTERKRLGTGGAARVDYRELRVATISRTMVLARGRMNPFVSALRVDYASLENVRLGTFGNTKR